MPLRQTCEHCGTPRDHVGLDGLCPRCLSLDLFTPQPDGAGPCLLPPDFTASCFGDYELLDMIARGGMGVVYRARQISLDRIVALKLMGGGLLAGDEAIARFKSEASAAASLQHPNIVAIHEIGEHRGQHYFSMDYVAGPTLGTLVREGPLPVRRAARYVECIAAAVDYAHSRGLLHRDLKPSNVLIDEQDQPRITDFGLAKRLDAVTSLTGSQALLGTPAFMAPEQADRARGEISARSDVYALGAVLYYLVTGRPPLSGESATEVLMQVVHAEPLAARLLNPAVPRDLETIISKCLAKEPVRRYATAGQLSDDLRRFLSEQPIQARPSRMPEKVLRWCKRKPAHATALFLLLVLAIGSPIAAFRINQARRSSEEHRRRALANLYVADMNLALQALESDNRGRAMELLRKHLPEAGEEDLRGFEWRYLRMQIGDDYEFQFGFHADAVRQVFFTTDGQTVASRSINGTAKIWDLAGGRERLTVTNVFLLGGFSPDGKELAVGSEDGSIEIVNVQTGHRVAVLTNSGLLVRLLADGHTIATTDTNSLLQLWNLNTGQLARTLPGIGGGGHWRGALWDLSVAITPDGKTLASIDKETNPWFVIKIWDVSSGNLLQQSSITPYDIDSLQISANGRYVALSFPQTGRFALWDWREQSEPKIIPGHLSSVRTMAFSSDSRFLATGTSDQVLKVWSLPEGALYRKFGCREQSIWSAAFSEDDKWVVTGGQSEPLRLWTADRHANEDTISGLSTLWSEGNGQTRITFSPDSRFMALACASNDAPIIELKTLEVVTAISNVKCVLGFSLDGNRALCVGPSYRSAKQGLMIWNRESGAVPCLFAASGTASTIQRSDHPVAVHLLNSAVSQDLKWAAVPFGDGRIELLDVAARRGLAVLQTHRGYIAGLIFSRGGRRLATAGSDGTMKLWEIPSGTLLAAFTNHTDAILGMDFSPDGEFIATASNDKTVRLWDVKAKREAAIVMTHRQPVSAIAFSRDGKLLAAGGADAAVTLWSVRLRQELAAFRLSGGDAVEPGKFVRAVAFSPDNNTLVARTADGTVRVWRAASWLEMAETK